MTIVQALVALTKKEITPDEAIKYFGPPKYLLSVDETGILKVGIWIDDTVEGEQEGCIVITHVINGSQILMDKIQLIPLSVIKDIHDRFIVGEEKGRKDVKEKKCNIIVPHPDRDRSHDPN